LPHAKLENLMKNFLRALQTHFPWMHDMRFQYKLNHSKRTGKPHEHDFNALGLFDIPDDKVFIDVGSNRGEGIQSTLITMKGENKIIGFEPNPLVFEKLRSYFNGNGRVELHNCGLGATEQTHPLYVPFYRNWMFDGLSSFKKSEAADWLKTRLSGFKEKRLSIKEVKCDIKTMDSFNLNPGFVKIDVQGFELEVLKGAVQTIEHHKPVMLIESISDDVVEFLLPFGYKFYSYENGALIEGKGALNTFCIVK